jgi:sucrose-6-phosphate hydrolase SacC (GH32 family)
MKRILLACAALLLTSALARSAGDLVIADFEGGTYGDWKTTGDAFGTGPAHGKLPGQQKVEGFEGNGLVNSFHNGDRGTGTLTSPPFKIERQFIKFLIGGGGFAGKTCLNLLVDGKVARTATGPHTTPGGGETLDSQSWDVSEFAGKEAVLEVVDQATGGWGHILVDQIVESDLKPPTLLNNMTRQITITHRYLRLPISNSGPKRRLTFLVDGKEEPALSIQPADGTPDWWAWKDVSAFQGKEITLQIDKLPEGSTALTAIEQADEIKDPENLYQEPLRPQFHFSSRQGKLNDPNGLLFYRGEYHLFYQHNPYGWGGGNQHWGHAVSRDLVHWKELGPALYPDAMGLMYSGSGVVDWKNTSGLGKEGKPPMVFFYTAAGNPTTQCMAYSLDGRTFTKYSANPVVKQITGGNRDPKVIWYEPTQRWVMALYVGLPSVEKDEKGLPKRNDTLHFLSSPNLKDWTVMSQIGGFFECPDFFELPVDGNAKNKKWVLTAASSDYMVGTFDGTTFTPETPKLQGNFGRGFYAAQTYSDLPPEDGRRVRIGWLKATSPGMAFNQAMSIPMELKLVTTPDGPRLTWTPVKELETLRGKAHHLDSLTLNPGDANPLANVHGELMEIRAKFSPGEAKEFNLNVRGATVSYDAASQELVLNDIRAKAPLRNGSQQLAIYVDRTSIEVFTDNGLVYMPQPFIPKADNTSLEVSAKGGAAKIETLDVYPLNSAWK